MKNLLFLFVITLTINIYTQEKDIFFDPMQLKPGMKGYALTVFQGLEPEKMNVEIIAYMPNKLTKSAMILVKLSGENVEQTRVAAGMSGSPVYIEGKLVGALAYTWENARELLAGVVPIQDMISDKKRGENTISSPLYAKPIQTAWSIDGLDSPELIKALQDISETKRYPKGVEEFISIPSSISNGIAPLKPGDSVAIKLIEGDINIASIGTVTYVDGENVYIYGHPMDSEGPISLPLAKAEIYDIMASTRLSFKIGSALSQTIGSTLFDGLSSVYGRFDKQAVMIPVTLEIIGQDYSNSYKMNMARSRKYLPTLLEEGIGAILERELGKNIERKVTLSWELGFTNNQIITNQVTWVKESIYEPRTIKKYWSDYISTLWNNSLVHLVPNSISFKLSIEDESYDYYAVEGLKSSRECYFAGETIDLQTILRGYLSDTIYTNFGITLPNNLEQGSYTILVGGAIAIENQLANLFPNSYMIRTTDQLLKELRKPINSNQLHAMLIDIKKGNIVGNTFLGNLPKSRRSLFKGKNIEGKALLSPKIVENKYVMDNPVIGSQSLTISVVIPEPLKTDGQ